MIYPSQAVRIVIATKPVDFRKGHDGLAALAERELGLDPHSGIMGSAPAQCRMTPQRKKLDLKLLKNMLSKFGTALKRGFAILRKSRAETVQNVFHNLFHNLVSTNGLQILIRN